MSNSDLFEFKKIFAKAEKFYKSVIKVHCPALNQMVHFSSDGFHHLQFDGTRTERTKVVQKNKLLCLEDAVLIIKKTTTIQEHRESVQTVGKPDVSGHRQEKSVRYYAFAAIINLDKKRRINVVVRRVGDGNFHFWSVSPAWKELKTNSQKTVKRIGGGWLLDS